MDFSTFQIKIHTIQRGHPTKTFLNVAKLEQKRLR